jgi:pimeloyl-ACP methyl ester carboxylesterase
MRAFFQRRWKVLCGFLVAGLAGGLILAWIVGGQLCAPCNRPVPLPANLGVEQVSFPSNSGAMIHGWLVTPATNRAVVILQHGIHGTKSSLVQRARFLTEAGYAVLMFDFQAHGESIGSHITFGYLESRDAQAAVAFAKNRFPGKRIGVIGLSLGAAAAALANPPLDVQALVLEMMYPTVVQATKDRIEMRLGAAGRWFSPQTICGHPFPWKTSLFRNSFSLARRTGIRSSRNPKKFTPMQPSRKISLPSMALTTRTYWCLRLNNTRK